MRVKVTLILVLLNIIAFWGTYQMQNKGMSGSEGFTDDHVLSPEMINIERLTLEGDSIEGKRRVLSRKGNHWVLESPVLWPANPYAVQRILTQLQFLKKETSFGLKEIEESGQGLSDYGLEDPLMKVTAENDLGVEELIFGRPTLIGNRIYVLASKRSEIFVVDKKVFNSLVVGLEDLRNPQVFNIPIFELNNLTVKLMHPNRLNIRLSKKDSSWFFEGPIQTSANSTLVEGAIGELTRLKVHKFISKKDSERGFFGLDKPRMKVTLRGNHKSETLLIGDLASETPRRFYAQLEDSPTYFIVDGAYFEALHKAQESLRDKFFVKFNLNKLNAIDIQQTDKRVQLNRLETGLWQVMNYNKEGTLLAKDADTDRILNLVEILLELEAVDFVNDAPSEADLAMYGFADPQRVIRLQGEESVALVLGNINSETGRIYAKIEGQPFVYEVDSYVLSEVPVSALKYESRMLERLPEVAQIKRFKIEDLETGKTLYELSEFVEEGHIPLGSVSDSKRDALLFIIQGLHQFEVDGYLANRFKKEFVLDKETTIPWKVKLEAEVILPVGNKKEVQTLEYYFTDRLSGGIQVGGSLQSKRTFTLTQGWIDALFTFTHMNLSPVIDPSNG